MPKGGPVYRERTVAVAPRALTASARAYPNGHGLEKIRKVGRRSRAREWQAELWDFYDTVPEFRFACDWVGNQLSRARLYVANKEGREDKSVAAVLDTFFGGREGQTEMLRLLGVNFTVAGEAWVIGQDTKDGDVWQVASSVEVTTEGQHIRVDDEVLKDALPIQIWKAHPRNGNEPNSPARAVIPTLSQLVKLSEVIDAQADSRLTGAGILWIPQEIDIPVPATVGRNEGDDDADPEPEIGSGGALMRQLINTAKRAFDDRSSAAAQIPLVIAAPGEFLEKIQHTEFWSGFDEHAQKLREECVKRMAIGMDMPPEVVTGTGEMNHWGSWQLEEAAIKSHTEPLLEIILGSLTTGWLRPALVGMGVENPEDYSLEADTSKLRLRPNRSKEALELYDRGALSRKTLLVENGFDAEVDLMDDAEFREWMLRKIATGSATPDQVAVANRLLGIAELPTESVQPTREARPTPSLEGHPNRSAPDEEDSESVAVVRADAGAPLVLDGLVYATEIMVHRALERAGNRLRNKVGRSFASAAAADLYLHVPKLSVGESAGLLEDAWSSLDRFTYPGVDNEELRDALDSFTVTLLRLQKPYAREDLARHLTKELS